MKCENSRTANTILNTVMGILNVFCNIVLNFILRTIFIYILGIQYTGVSSVFSGILGLLSLSELGISVAITTALYKPLYNKDEEKIRKLMRFYKVAYRFIALFIFIFGMILTPFLKYLVTDIPDIKESIYIIFVLYIVKTSVSYLLIYKTTILNADQKQYIVKKTETVCLLARYIIEIIFLVIFKNFMVYLVIEILSTILQNIIVTNKATKLYPYAFRKTNQKLEKSEIKSLFKDIKGLTMYKISGSIGNSIDSLLISSFIGVSAAGLLANYTLISQQIQNLILQFLNSTTASIGNLRAEGNNERQLLVFNRLFYISFFIINFCSTCLFVLFNPFIMLWIGEQYLLSIEIAFVIAFDSFLYILLQAIVPFRTANGIFIKGQYRPLITSILNIILSIVLIRKLGIFGTILATIICRLVTQWYDPFILFKYIFNAPFVKFYIRYLLYIFIFLVSSFITYFITSLIIMPNPIASFLLKCILCCIIPNVCVFLFTFKTEEYRFCINFFNSKIKGVFKKFRRN